MEQTEKAPAPPKRCIGGTTDQGKNSKVAYRTTKSPLKMKKNN